jgi:hypothetical protein
MGHSRDEWPGKRIEFDGTPGDGSGESSEIPTPRGGAVKLNLPRPQ